MQRLLNLNALRPWRYDLQYVFLSIAHPRALLLQTIHLKPSEGSNSSAAADSSSSSSNSAKQNSTFLIHAASSSLNILHVVGATLKSAAPPSEDDSIPPFMQDVATFDVPAASEKIHLLIDVKVDEGVRMNGITRGSYTLPDAPDKKKTIVSTHFEPCVARHAYACIDEPNARAETNFSFLLAETEENASLMCLTGGRQRGAKEEKQRVEFALEDDKEARRLIDEWVARQCAAIDVLKNDDAAAANVTFAKHTFSSTGSFEQSFPPYLSIFAIGEFDFVEPAEKYVSKLSGREISTRFYFCRGRNPELARFGVDHLKFALGLFEEYFDMPYAPQLPNLDMIAIPNFAIGGEESPGLIAVTDRLLVDPAKTAIARLRGLADLVIHEVSHIVHHGSNIGITSWSQLFNKEGAASFFGAYGCDIMHPTWEAYEAIRVGQYDALSTDGYAATHAVDVEITHTSQATSNFDSLSYNKGCSLFFWAFKVLGDEAYKNALRHFCKTYYFKNPTSPQLWEAFTTSSGRPISKMMDAFTRAPGFPLVSASLTADGKTLRLEQRPFALAATEVGAEKKQQDTVWTVPIDIAFGGGGGGGDKAATTQVVLDNASATCAVPDAAASSSSSCVLVNVDHNGFYRTSYDTALFSRIVDEANYVQLSADFRVGLLDDVVALVDAGGEQNLRNLLAFLKVFEKLEKSPQVLMHASSRLPGVFSLLDEIFGKTQSDAFMASLLRDCYGAFAAAAARLGPSTVEKEEPILSQLRSACFGAVSRARGIACTRGWADSFAVEPLFEKLLASGKDIADKILASGGDDAKLSVDANMTVVALKAVVKTHHAEYFDKLWGFFKSHPNALVSRDVVLALCATDDEAQFRSMCEETYAGDTIDSSLGHVMTFHLAANAKFRRSVLWPVFQKKIDTIIARWGSGQFRIQMICERIGVCLPATQQGAAEFKAFFAPHVGGSLQTAALAIRRAEQDIMVRAALVEQSVQDVDSAAAAAAKK